MLDATGVFRDGSDTTAVNMITPIDANNFTWQSVKRTLDGVSLPDTPPVKVTSHQIEQVNAGCARIDILTAKGRFMKNHSGFFSASLLVDGYG